MEQKSKKDSAGEMLSSHLTHITVTSRVISSQMEAARKRNAAFVASKHLILKVLLCDF